MAPRQTYPCCRHCVEDPEYHAENPADSHDVACVLCATGATRIVTQVGAILDRYSDGDEVESCQPEDRWRLYRDLRAALKGGGGD